MKQQSLRAQAEGLQSQLVTWRRELHAHPELSFEEHLTSAFVANVLDGLGGYQVTRNVAKTGVVAELRSGEGPLIALRADMDALPIEEKNTFAFRSQSEGRMHACGHDGHTSMLLGAAVILKSLFAGGKLRGGVRLLFQPAEEAADADGKSGAPYMLEEGALDGVDLALALHVNPAQPYGSLQLWSGAAMASVDTFEGALIGKGSHGGYPHLGVDPLWMLVPVLSALHGIVSRRVSPLETAVVTVGSVNGGSAPNIIPDEVALSGTMRTFDVQTREVLEAEVRRAFSLARELGGDFRLRITRESPALRNAPLANRLMQSALRALYPEAQETWAPFGMPGEDFAYIAEKVPAAMAFLGCATPDRVDRGLHTPIFDMDERCLPMGAALMADCARQALSGEFAVNEDKQSGVVFNA